MLNLLRDPAFRQELVYVSLIFGLFVLPRLLQRYRIPSAITSFGLGAVAALGFGLFRDDHTLHLLATFGITGLFLFAGLEVEVAELRKNLSPLVRHLAARALLLAAATLAAHRVFALDLRAACLVALAILTPSTGFILGSLGRFGLERHEVFLVKSRAIGSELLSLGLLFAVLRSESAAQLGLSFLALLLLTAVLPVLFLAFARWIAPHAPRSEFAFLVMMAVVFAFATRRLGVYYLVGAFMVGMAAQMFRRRLPGLTASPNLHAVEVFASFFAPFYFFGAGLHLRREDFVPAAGLVTAGLLGVAVPVQALLAGVGRGESFLPAFRRERRVVVALMPTLVFTLVLAEILRDRFHLSGALYGGLVGYALLTTLLPGFVLGGAAPEYETPRLPEDSEDSPAAETAADAPA